MKRFFSFRTQRQIWVCNLGTGTDREPNHWSVMDIMNIICINITRINYHLPQILQPEIQDASSNWHLSEARATKGEGRMKRKRTDRCSNHHLWNRSWCLTSLLQRGSCPVEYTRLNLASQFLIIWNISVWIGERKDEWARPKREEKELGNLQNEMSPILYC